MMTGRYLLDTNIVIGLLEGENRILEALSTVSEAFISTTVLGELYYGAFNSSRRTQNLQRIADFKEEITLLTCDEFTAEIYGQLKQRLKKIGRPVPENDIWIAASAIQHDLILASRDKHFLYMENLMLENWAS